MGKTLLQYWRANDRTFQNNTQALMAALLIALWLNCLSDIFLYMYPFTMAIIISEPCPAGYYDI